MTVFARKFGSIGGIADPGSSRKYHQCSLGRGVQYASNALFLLKKQNASAHLSTESKSGDRIPGGKLFHYVNCNNYLY